MRSVAAIAAVTALFAGILVGGLSYTGALDPAMLQGANEDQSSPRAGWKTHSLPEAGFSIQLPPDWEMVKAEGTVVFRVVDGKNVLASLAVAPAAAGNREEQSVATVKRFVRGDRALTFRTSAHGRAAYALMFEEAAKSFKPIG